MPVLFIGHGSPMNAIANNDFTRSLNALGKKIPAPRAILCVSAHWLTDGTSITHMPKPKTIHDFYGFPEELFAIQYPAPGSPAIAELVAAELNSTETSAPKVQLDDTLWGLDHGTWSVLRHLYPEANIPVLQLSINYAKPGQFHFEVGEQLRALRSQGVLIVGSGNIVHNLRQLEWDPNAKPYDWALEFDEGSKQKLIDRDFQALTQNYLESNAGRLSVPTPDHYYPLLYTLGAAEKNDHLSFEYEGIEHGSISMRAFSLGLES